MKRLLLSALLIGGSTALCSAADFEPPVRLKAGDAAIRVENPGYAAPCWADLKGNGKNQLLVGQFNQGKIPRLQAPKCRKVRAGRLVTGRREGSRSAGGVVMHQLHSTVSGS